MHKKGVSGAVAIAIVLVLLGSGWAGLGLAGASPASDHASASRTAVPGGSAAVGSPSSARPTVSMAHALSALTHPLATTPSVSFVAGVGAFTSDPKVVNNTGINATIDVPTVFTPPANACFTVSYSGFSGQICAFLGVEEPLNATSTIGIGVVLTVLPSLGYKVFPVGILPGSGNGSFVIDMTSKTGLPGGTYDFSIVHLTGDLWNYAYNNANLNNTPSYNLSHPVAVGLSSSNRSLVGAPAEALFELGNTSFTLPQTLVPEAIGIELNGTTSTSYEPVSGNALLLNASFLIGIEGHNQYSPLAGDSVIEGGSLSTVPFPGQFAALWGNAAPLGVMTPQTAAYTTESAVAGSTGLRFNVTIPTTSEGKGQAELLVAQEPLNGSVEIGVGVAFVGTAAYPLYSVRTGLATPSTYIDGNLSLASGTSVTLAAQAVAGGAWQFTENGQPIAKTSSGAGNGTAPIGLASATAFVGNSFYPASVLYSESTFPLLALFGNGTLASVNATTALSFDMPGRGWATPDYAFDYNWGTTFSTEGNCQFTVTCTPGGIPQGDALLGDALAHPGSGAGSALWEGVLHLTITATPSVVLSNGWETVVANLSSGLAPPASPGLCVVLSNATGCLYSFNPTPSRASGNWEVFNSTFLAFTVHPAGNMTMGITVLATPLSAYLSANASTSVTVTSPTLTVQVTTPSSTILAGQSAPLSIWVNSTAGTPVTKAWVNASGPAAANLTSVGAVYVGPGHFTDTLKTQATLTANTVLTITFTAVNPDDFTGSQSVSITVNALPLLSVALATSAPSSGVASGGKLFINASVTVNGQAQSGVNVTLLISPGTPSWSGTTWGLTDANGQVAFLLTAPTVSSKTSFNISAAATLSGDRSGAGSASVPVNPPSSPAPSGGSSNLELYAILGVIAVVVIVGAVLMLRRKKTAPSSGAGEAPAYPPAEGEAPPQ